MKFKPEDAVFRREEYPAHLAAQRSKNYPPLTKKEVAGKVKFRSIGFDNSSR